MKKSEIIKFYNNKIKDYIKHSKLYYNKSKPIISDSSFDDLKLSIFELEKKHNFLNNKNSPSKIVGFKPSKSFEKYTHRVPMLSLSNAFYEERS